MLKHRTKLFLGLLAGLIFTDAAFADPCGMVPPIYNGEGPPITRIGRQKTFVFYKDGIESFVIRPGFTGNVDEFGMLIPFPSVPAIRKVPDNIFEQIGKAIDPPEVVIDLRSSIIETDENAMLTGAAPPAPSDPAIEVVRVIKREAVGMYEVAVLAAGSAESLKKWMTDHGFRYPTGMDRVTQEYIDQKWCFVAVKTRVAEKDGVDPKPAQRSVNGKMKAGSSFDGFVQGMGFRFKTDKLVVPMRLSTFNGRDFHNVVYVMADGPKKIQNIPEEYVVRQISGKQLLHNVTQPLPLRVIGGTEEDLKEYPGLKQQRDPNPKNGLAKQLFASDLMAASSGNLSLKHEEDEKQLLKIGEHFGLRGAQIDRENAVALKAQANKITEAAIKDLSKMTLTIVDGDFPRDVLAKENLTFAEFQMAAKLNVPLKYDATKFGPGLKKTGVLIQTGMLNDKKESSVATANRSSIYAIGFVGLGLAVAAVSFLIRRNH